MPLIADQASARCQPNAERLAWSTSRMRLPDRGHDISYSYSKPRAYLLAPTSGTTDSFSSAVTTSRTHSSPARMPLDNA